VGEGRAVADEEVGTDGEEESGRRCIYCTPSYGCRVNDVRGLYILYNLVSGVSSRVDVPESGPQGRCQSGPTCQLRAGFLVLFPSRRPELDLVPATVVNRDGYSFV
jgi:hypothetical protein